MLLRKSTDYDRQLHGLMERLKLQQANNAALLAARRGLPTPPQAVQPVPVDTRTNAEKRADKILQAQELRTKLLTLMDATDAAVVLGRLTNAEDISTFNNIFPQVAVEAKKFDHVRPSQLINIFRELKSIPSTVDVTGRITGSRNAQQRKVDAVNRAIANFRNIMRVLVSSIEGVLTEMSGQIVGYPDVVQDLWLVWVLDKVFEGRQIQDNIPSRDLERLYALSEDWPTMAQVKTNVLSKTTPSGKLRTGVSFEKYMDEIMKIIYMPLDTIKELAELFGMDVTASQALIDEATNYVAALGPGGANQIAANTALRDILANAPSTSAPAPGAAALGPAVPPMAIEAPPVTEQDDAPVIEEITHAPALPIEPVPTPQALPVALIDPADPTTRYPNTQPVASYFPGLANYAMRYMAIGNIAYIPTSGPDKGTSVTLTLGSTDNMFDYLTTETQYNALLALWNPKVDFMNMFISQIHAIYPVYAPPAALRFVPIEPKDPVPGRVRELMATSAYSLKSQAKRDAIDADVAAGDYDEAATKLGFGPSMRTALRAPVPPGIQLRDFKNDYQSALRQITDNEINNLFPLIEPTMIGTIPTKFLQSFVVYSLITSNWNGIQTAINPAAGVATLTDLRLTEVYMRMQKFWQPLGGYFPQFVNSTRDPTVSRPVIGMGMHQQPRRPRSHLRVYMGRGVATSQATDEGVTVYNGPTYVPFGPYQIHRSKLIKERRIHVRTHTGGAVINMDASDHPAIVEVLKNLLKNHTLDYQAVAKMGNEDRTLLAKMLERCKMDEEYEVPYEDTEMTRFNLLKDHIIAGGNNKDEIREFRQLLMKFVREKKVGHAAALEIIDELIQL